MRGSSEQIGVATPYWLAPRPTRWPTGMDVSKRFGASALEALKPEQRWPSVEPASRKIRV